ncbi:DUF1501 domain-containing protein [Rubinisphaera margarita]|uniref:DUF1501 domain-containing protein n=1 Tax=Rubinisphaera margarita TaxID=2909586 RepID=UPI001EE7B227|nr:DUF1501 domain-containing protein [Rubinisphaera margarita]MCG6157494.1 DUF1501 domain-containing protein [Rubinisphaera margarita]
MNPNSPQNGPMFARRDFLYSLTASLGPVAFSSMLAQAASEQGSTASRGPHFPEAKAKHCIFLYMEGGPSHVDTFDPKPKLSELHMQEFQRNGERQSAMSSGKRYYVESPFKFAKHGESGADMCDRWEHLPQVADELCFYRGCQVESVNHPTANYHVNTGNRFGGDPSIGAWVTYGLGSENSDLPGFIVLPELAFPQGGAANWSNGYLPTALQGTPLRSKGSPILDIAPPAGISREHQRKNLDYLQEVNARLAARHPEHADLAARMQNYELAFRMQTQVPEVLSLDNETQQTLDNYGIDQQPTDNFGRRCLLARKLVEKGVRFVQVYASTWDSHDYIAKAHGALIPTVDKPIAALIADLKERDLLDETLIVWMGEFGRTPDNGVRGGGLAYGRDHNPNAMTVWMAGGGCKAGHTIGATDELGATAVENVHHIRDFHVTLLRLLGLDDNKLTYYHAGRFKQLSQFGGQVISELIG